MHMTGISFVITFGFVPIRSGKMMLLSLSIFEGLLLKLRGGGVAQLACAGHVRHQMIRH
jgi:hypothetical protein